MRRIDVGRRSDWSRRKRTGCGNVSCTWGGIENKTCSRSICICVLVRTNNDHHRHVGLMRSGGGWSCCKVWAAWERGVVGGRTGCCYHLSV